MNVGLPEKLQACVYAFQQRYPSYNVGIKINSGTRCMQHNSNVGGSVADPNKSMSGSMHLWGKAVDLYLYDKLTNKHIPDEEIAEYFGNMYPDSCGIGRYKGRTHFDDRNEKARWTSI